MMAGLFLIFLLILLLILAGMRRTAIVLGVVNLFLILALFWHHVTDVVPINL